MSRPWTHENSPVVVFNNLCIFLSQDPRHTCLSFSLSILVLIVRFPYVGIISHHTGGDLFFTDELKKEDWANQVYAHILRCKYWRCHGEGLRDNPPNPGLSLPPERFCPPIL